MLLSAVAGATTRLQLLTSVLVAPYYRALVLANQAATLDVVSGGRLILGVGTGWNPDECNAARVPARERGTRTDDHLGAAEAGLTACTLWLSVAAEHVGEAMEWIASEVAPQLARGVMGRIGRVTHAAAARGVRPG